MLVETIIQFLSNVNICIPTKHMQIRSKVCIVLRMLYLHFMILAKYFHWIFISCSISIHKRIVKVVVRSFKWQMTKRTLSSNIYIQLLFSAWRSCFQHCKLLSGTKGVTPKVREYWVKNYSKKTRNVEGCALENWRIGLVEHPFHSLLSNYEILRSFYAVVNIIPSKRWKLELILRSFNDYIKRRVH